MEGQRSHSHSFTSPTSDAAAGGSTGTRYKLMSPAKLPISRSTSITIPPGLSPTSFLESPLLLSNIKESLYPSINTSAYKFGLSEPGSLSYYDYGHTYVVGDCTPQIDEFRSPMENSASMPSDRPAAVHPQHEEISSSTSQVYPVDCLRGPHSTDDYQVVWQDDVDPDNMTYEELLDLGETVGTQSRGLSQENISLLPISKFKCGFFSRRKSRKERCVICQMEYKRGDQQISLPCKHIYHASCCSRWLSIKKACPICYKEVFANASKQSAM